MEFTTLFEQMTIVDHDLQLQRATTAIAEDIHMKDVKCKHEGALKRFVGHPRANPKAQGGH